MTENEFMLLAQKGYQRIPLILETFADLDTPLSLYVKLAHTRDGAMSCLLESVVGGERFGRYSFIGLPAQRYIRATGTHIEVFEQNECIEALTGDPIDFVRTYMERYKVYVPEHLPRFAGGLAGYFGHDMVRHMEPTLGPCVLPSPNKMGDDVPDMLLMQVDELAIIDNLAGKLFLIVYADPREPSAYAKAHARLESLRAAIRQPVDLPFSYGTEPTAEERDFEKPDYIAAVLKAKEYIMAGDLMQVQVGQVIRKPFSESPLALYRALRTLNPSPYMYFWNFGTFHVVGASPEILVRQEKVTKNGEPVTKVTIRPLAGTRKRGKTPEEDLALAEELRHDPKEVAEHVMLIDLARNDVGRISSFGSVQVSDQMVIERYSHVMHLVSNVEGNLLPDMDCMDVLRASFPAGTLTGAPKVRAMELIDELEPVRRCVYGGAAGYISYSGDMDVAIAIRTSVIKNNYLFAQASAGIVADSDPEKEWQETEDKARAILRAAELVQKGLDHQLSSESLSSKQGQ